MKECLIIQKQPVAMDLILLWHILPFFSCPICRHLTWDRSTKYHTFTATAVSSSPFSVNGLTKTIERIPKDKCKKITQNQAIFVPSIEPKETKRLIGKGAVGDLMPRLIHRLHNQQTTTILPLISLVEQSTMGPHKNRVRKKPGKNKSNEVKKFAFSVWETASVCHYHTLLKL